MSFCATTVHVITVHDICAATPFVAAPSITSTRPPLASPSLWSSARPLCVAILNIFSVLTCSKLSLCAAWRRRLRPPAESDCSHWRGEFRWTDGVHGICLLSLQKEATARCRELNFSELTSCTVSKRWHRWGSGTIEKSLHCYLNCLLSSLPHLKRVYR